MKTYEILEKMLYDGGVHGLDLDEVCQKLCSAVDEQLAKKVDKPVEGPEGPTLLAFKPGHEPKLARCGYCGSGDVKSYMQPNTMKNVMDCDAPFIRFYVECFDCEAMSSGNILHGLQEAIDDWNDEHKK